tara:strand:- start:206 stop:457 length:252 start_codon:yes stop_codon:yes gene_type:complete
MWALRTLSAATAKAFGAPAFGLRAMTSHGGNRWNARAPRGWRYARDMKRAQGENYITKQARARMEGRQKGEPPDPTSHQLAPS